MSRGALLRGTASKNATACLATMASGGDDPVVSPLWLSSRLSEVKVLDATWYLPKFNKDGRDDFGSARIPGARYFDIDAIADKSADLKHMLPPPGAFAAAAESLNIKNSDTVVVYETNGIAFAAARAWWMFRCFGHENVKVLDGGLPAWKEVAEAEGKESFALDESPVTSDFVNSPGNAAVAAQALGASELASRQWDYRAVLNESLVTKKDEILSDLAKREQDIVLLDARGGGRYRGAEKEAKPGLRSGHIPGSYSMPYATLLTEGQRMVSVDDFAAAEAYQRKRKPRPLASSGEVLEAVGGGSQGKRIAATCGSGVTACVLALAFARAGCWDVAVYDGSWSDWGADRKCPVETG